MRASTVVLVCAASAGAFAPCSRLAAPRVAPLHLFDAKGNPIAPTASAGDGDVDHDQTLGELIFSSRDPRMEVAANPDLFDEAFCDFVEAKAEDSDDLEERAALQSLVEMVRATRAALEAAANAPARTVVDVGDGAAPTATVDGTRDILAAARAATTGDVYDDADDVAEATATEAGLEGEQLATYDALLRDLAAASDVATAVEAAYERCDYALLTLASARRDAGDASAGAVVDAVNALAATRLEQAAARLGGVLRVGSPAKMMDKIAELAVTGDVDGAFLELLEANRQQAAGAGAAGAQAAELMGNLARRCRDELDKRVGADAPEKRLVRALLRADDADQQRALLQRAFEPKEAIALGFGDDAPQTQEGPEVEPPAFIDACKALIADFGNVQVDDGGDTLEQRVQAIATLAEVVATEIYGECATPQEQQDRMWKEGTTSVFDLEAAEMHAETEGERMPWQDDRYDDMLPDGFDQAGRKQIGGG